MKETGGLFVTQDTGADETRISPSVRKREGKHLKVDAIHEPMYICLRVSLRGQVELISL